MLGPNSRSATGLEGGETQASQRARQVFNPDGRGLSVRDRERGKGEVRMTGGARLSSSTLR